MQHFKELYNYCQTLKPKVSRTLVLEKALEITEVSKVKAVVTGMDSTVCRGMFISAQNLEHPLIQRLGCDVILLARGQKYCWERFVYTKELMHVFDREDEPTNTPNKLETLLTDFEVPSANTAPSTPTISDIKGFWMALACLCPESNRLEFQHLREKNHIDNYGVALQLRIPEQYVPMLFQDRYLKIIENLLSN